MAKKKMTKKTKKFFKSIVVTLLVIVVLFIAMCFVSGTEEDDSSILPDGTIQNLELPAPMDGEQIIRHTGYTLSYNEKYELPSYVAYELTRNEVLGGEEREDNFREDPAVRTGSATLADYRGSGYDRGHLAPAADFKWSAEAMSDTFFMSNMSPQDPSFNRGIWADLEAAVRVMAYENGKVYVVTGPVLTDGPYETIGKNEVAVPKRFYKVVLDYTEPEIKAIGFILNNEGSSKSLESFAVSVDEVERVTGLDFYPALPDDQEEIIESKFNTSQWSFKTTLPKDASPDDSIAEGYVTGASEKDKYLDMILSYMYKLKELVFEYTGTEDIARKFGLL